MSREDQYSVAVTIDGEDYGIWDKFSGGEADSTELKYKPGGLQPEISLGGSKSVANITVSRLYDLNRDHQRIPALLAKVGKGTVTISKQPLDVDGNAFGRPLVYNGKLKSVKPPDTDSESTNAGLIALEITPSATIG